ncbi:MAG: hypothetical protein U1E23_10260 [Reyranellaceae bacterium]
MQPVPQPDDQALLAQKAREARDRAARVADCYNRTTWYRFVAVFFPVPFIVVLLRLEIESWAYAVAGAMIILSGAILYVIDGRAADSVAEAERQAEAAERALAVARAEATAAGSRAAEPSAPA